MNRTVAIILSLFLLTALAGGLLALAQAAGDPPTELYVRTVPAGAKVFIDGKEVGVSDDLFEVKPGTRKVKVELSGYEPAVKKAIVPESRIERVVFELEKKAEEDATPVPSGGFGPAIEEVHGWLFQNMSLNEVLWRIKTEYDSLADAYSKKDLIAVDKHVEELEELINFTLIETLGLPRWRAEREKSPAEFEKRNPGRTDHYGEYRFEVADRRFREIQSSFPDKRQFDRFKISVDHVLESGGDLHQCLHTAGGFERLPEQYATLRERWEVFWKQVSAKIPDLDEFEPADTKKMFFPARSAPADWPEFQYALDLASGRVWSVRSDFADLGEEFAKKGAGDLIIAPYLACLRGGKVGVWDGKEYVDLSPERKTKDITYYGLPPLPCRLLVATAEGKQFEVRVLSITDAGASFEYRAIDASLAPTDEKTQESDTKIPTDDAASKKMIALVEDFFRHNFRDVTARETIEWGEVEEHENGHKSIRYKYFATIWGKKKQLNQRFTFDSDGKFVKCENVEGFSKGEETSDASEAATDKEIDRREIGKKVKDFPEKQDLSTPESAWAAYTRASGNKDAEGVVALSWVKIDPAEMERFWRTGDFEDMAVYNQAQLDSECIEVLTLPENMAAVISRLEFPEGKGRHPYSVRFFGLHDGKWKNLGEDRCPTLEAARKNVRRKIKAAFSRFERMGVELTTEEYARKAADNRGVPKPPQAVEVVPAIGATDVDSNLKEIRATFDRDMDTEGMSWCGGGEHFPEIDGEATWIDKRTCVLPVKLEEGKAYRLALNWEKYRNFRSADDVPVAPTAVYFCTKGAGPELLAQMTPPKVVKLSIENGAKDIPPGRTKLSVTFDQPMGAGMSWCNGEDTPTMEAVEGSAWSEDKKTCSIYALLEPGHDYVIYLNSASHGNFMNEVGVSLEPVVWKFSTAE